MGVSRARGGLALGLWQTSLYWAVLIVGFVTYLAATRRDVERVAQ